MTFIVTLRRAIFVSQIRAAILWTMWIQNGGQWHNVFYLDCFFRCICKLFVKNEEFFVKIILNVLCQTIIMVLSYGTHYMITKLNPGHPSKRPDLNQFKKYYFPHGLYQDSNPGPPYLAPTGHGCYLIVWDFERVIIRTISILCSSDQDYKNTRMTFCISEGSLFYKDLNYFIFVKVTFTVLL